MEIHFTQEQEAQLSRIASTAGTDVESLIKNAALRLLEDDRFRAAVIEGEEALKRGEYLTHEQVARHLERFLRN